MKYKKPTLYRIFPDIAYNALCASGDYASTGTSCKSGTEASGSGCSSGAAAGSRCTAGTAAGQICNNGVCFE